MTLVSCRHSLNVLAKDVHHMVHFNVVAPVESTGPFGLGALLLLYEICNESCCFMHLLHCFIVQAPN